MGSDAKIEGGSADKSDIMIFAPVSDGYRY